MRHQVAVQRFLGDERGHVRAMVLAEVEVQRDADGRRIVTPIGEEVELPCDLALFAIGFEGVEHGPLLDDYGLALTKRLVEVHGGRIRASNRPEGGALFEIFLPLRGAQDTQVGADL